MASDFPYLYPHSLMEAKRRRETELYKDSFRENVKCAWAIDKVVRDRAREGETVLAEDCIQPVLKAYGFKRVCFVLSNSLREMAQPRLVSEDVRKWSQLPWVLPDGKRNRQFAVEASAPQLEALIRQTRTAYQALGLFGPEHCAGDPFKLNYEGKVLVLSPGALKENHWALRDQLWFAAGGFGCSPSASGRAVYAVRLSDGKETRWNREDFTGVLDEQYLPDWAAEKLAELQAKEQPEPSSGGMEMT